MYQYEVAKQKGGKNYFCYEVGEQLPIKGTFGDKKKVMKIAASLNGVSYADFVKNRKNGFDIEK